MGFPIKHGLSRTPEYIAWRNMRLRCTSPNQASYPVYGGRGIKVCDAWADVHQFIKDMGPRPAGTSLDRIDVNGDYTPENCRWADFRTQCLNKRDTVMMEFEGQEKPLREVAEQIGIDAGTLWVRVKRYGIDHERAASPGRLRPWRHGTRHGYETGCRCEECRAAHAARHRAMRAKRRAKAMPVASSW